MSPDCATNYSGINLAASRNTKFQNDIDEKTCNVDL